MGTRELGGGEWKNSLCHFSQKAPVHVLGPGLVSFVRLSSVVIFQTKIILEK